MSTPLIAAERVSKYFPIGRRLFGAKRYLRAVSDVSFAVGEGETFALVGESGCGKSTTARLLLALELPTGGRVVYRGRPLTELKGEALAEYRRRVQVVFQSSSASLNPRKTVGQVLKTALTVSGALPASKKTLVQARIEALLVDVGLTPPEAFMDRYPHELSGGQRQRVGIARALATEPDVVVADEPVSALDISVRAQILALLAGLQRNRHLSFVFISHDLAVVRAVAHRVGVMYLGRLIEVGPVKEVFERPLHPYTEVLISATPASHPRIARERVQLVISGDVPSPINLPPGCPFHPRCPIARDVCRQELPPLREVTPGVQVACHFADQRLANDPATSLTGGGS